MSAEDSSGRVQALADSLRGDGDPLPVLRDLLLILETGNPETQEAVKDALLHHFEKVRQKSTLEFLLESIQGLQRVTSRGGPAETFVENTRKACDLLIRNQKDPDLTPVYNRMIRTFSQSYLFDGTRARCPECGSTEVGEGPNSMYEFTDMQCRHCGHRNLADDYRLEDWYPPG